MNVMRKYFILTCLLFLFISSNSYAKNEWSYCAERMNVAGLVQPYFVKYIKQHLNGRKTIYYYVNQSGGPVVYYHKEKKVKIPNRYMRPINLASIQFISDSFKRLSAIIDLKFKRVSNSKNADIAINNICITKTNICGKDIFGDVKQHIFINICSFRHPTNALITRVFLHELGHALGLEHPFDDNDYDCIYTTKPFAPKSANLNETQMAYKMPANKSVPIWYSKHDIKALIKIWGPAK